MDKPHALGAQAQGGETAVLWGLLLLEPGAGAKELHGPAQHLGRGAALQLACLMDARLCGGTAVLLGARPQDKDRGEGGVCKRELGHGIRAALPQVGCDGLPVIHLPNTVYDGVFVQLMRDGTHEVSGRLEQPSQGGTDACWRLGRIATVFRTLVRRSGRFVHRICGHWSPPGVGARGEAVSCFKHLPLRWSLVNCGSCHPAERPCFLRQLHAPLRYKKGERGTELEHREEDLHTPRVDKQFLVSEA
mmetsp:Transcript_14688/g.41327  ORF Transcript_14688/g.41327 Transcript_14688/m.41327 type:complete len:247 (-) Transcript_14688:24-764(-)